MVKSSQQSESSLENVSAEQGESQNGHSPLFESGSVQQTLAEDPLAIFLNKYWRQVVVVAAIIAAGFYAKNVFEETYTASMQRAAAVFSDMRAQYANLNSLLAEQEKLKGQPIAQGESAEKSETDKQEQLKKQIEDSETRLLDLLRALQDEREPYRSLGNLYRGLFAHQKGDFEAMQAQLGSFNWKAAEASSKERYFAELAALALARAELDQDSQRESGQSLLKQLAAESEYVQVSAALTLARIAKTEQERTEISQQIESILQKSPQQSEILEPELSRLKQDS